MPVISLLVTFILGFASASYFAFRLSEVAAVNDHLDDVKQIEALAVSYWLDEDAEKRDICAHKLRGKLHASAVFRARFGKVLGHRMAEYADLEGRLFDLATGGTFQTAGFEPDPATAVSIMQLSNETRALLRRVRRHVYWAH